MIYNYDYGLSNTDKHKINSLIAVPFQFIRDPIKNSYYSEYDITFILTICSYFFSINDGNADGENSNKNVSAYGTKINFIRFIGKTGRIEGQIEYMNANGFTSMPPEALNGLSDNRTFRTHLNGSLLLGKSLSLNSSLMYLDDARYDNFIKLQGEVRAHF